MEAFFSVHFQLPWEKVRSEMVSEKGIDSSVADAIGLYVKMKGGAEILDELMKNESFVANEKAKEGLQELKKLAKYGKVLEFSENVSLSCCIYILNNTLIVG